MRREWEEIDPRERQTGVKRRRPYVVLRAKEGKIYFSYRLTKEYLVGSRGIIVRYNRKLNMLSFLPTQNGERGYKLSSRNTISARNVFNMMKKRMKNKRAYYMRYNKEVKWLEICLNKSDEGDMKWLKA